MSLTNYSDLQIAVGNWIARTDLTAFIPDFITLAESAINGEPAIRNIVLDTPLTSTVGSRNLTLPTDFLEPRELLLNAFNIIQPLPLYTRENMFYGTVNSIPNQWAVNGSLIDLSYPADAVYSFTLRYRGSLNLASTTTNWLMTSSPDVYLFATLAEAYSFMKDPQAAALWLQRYQVALDAMAWQEARSQGLAPLSVDGALVGKGQFNIYSGFSQ